MTDEKNAIDVVRAYLSRVIEAGDAAAIDELVAPAFVNRDPPPGFATDRDGLRAIVGLLHSAIEGFRVAVEDIALDESGWVVARSRLTGRLRRPLFGQPAGAQLDWPLIDQFRIGRGKIVERRELKTK